MSSNDNQANTGNQTGSNIGASRGTGETHAGSNPLHTEQQQDDRAALSAALSDPNTAEQLQKAGDTSREKRLRLREQQQNNSNNCEHRLASENYRA
jgi:hypothetical protein